MAGSIGLKLVGMIKGMQENILAKEYFLDPSTFTVVQASVLSSVMAPDE